MTPSQPQNAPRDDFGDEVLPFDGDTDLLNLNPPADENSDDDQAIDWEAVEAELEGWTAGEGTDSQDTGFL